MDKVRRQFTSPVVPFDYHSTTSIAALFNSTEENDTWPHFLRLCQGKIYKYISNHPEQQHELEEKLEKAKKRWHCNSCSGFEKEAIDSGFIECGICKKWYHQKCVNMTVSVPLIFRL